MEVDGPDTVVAGDARASRVPTEAEAADAVAGLPRSEARYHVLAALASGGMGEVLTAHDAPLAREVVIKRMRTAKPSAESITRFLREARIQGSLQHPAIVPVHDLAVDAAGRPFFVMKALPGETLASILSATRTGGTKWSRAQLLRAFIDVCLAIELAHTRGILHRDLKPANIALGDFGEVYVLDWGVARVMGDDHPDTLEGYGTPRVEVDGAIDDWPLAGESPPTRPGAILGTPGYMSPEQMRADPDLKPASDIYSLGCILFEILSGEPLHSRSGPLASTALGADARPSRRIIVAPTPVSPELDAICVKATANLPADRFPTARALADAVQRYLDGDRDVARRKELAGEHLRDARAALARNTDDGRQEAVRAAGRALALDPESTEAADLIGHLVTAAPAAMPDELKEDLEKKILAEGRRHARNGLFGLMTYALYLPVFLYIGVRDWTWLIVTYSLVFASSAFTATSLRLRNPAGWRAWVTMCSSALLVALFARLVGPFVLPAGMACVSMAVSSTNPHLLRRGYIVLACFLTAALAPWGLEALGVLSKSYWTTKEGFVLTSPILDINPGPGQVAIAGYIVAVLCVMALLVFRIARANQEIRAKLELQAWHLRQLVPQGRVARGSIPPPSS